MKWNKHRLVSKRGQKYSLDRQNWTTYHNFIHMYEHRYEEMVSAGVAERLYQNLYEWTRMGLHVKKMTPLDAW